jgi:hypothetical protein
VEKKLQASIGEEFSSLDIGRALPDTRDGIDAGPI